MYKLKNISDKNLIAKGFRQNYDSWTLYFPVYFYNKVPTTFCLVTICPEESKKLLIDVRRANGSPHHQWHQKNLQAYKVIDEIDKNIKLKMKKIGARWYDD